VASPQHYCIAGDLGGTNIRAALVALDGTFVRKVKDSTGADPLADTIRLIESLLPELPAGAVLSGICLAVAGIVDPEAGIVLRSPNLPALAGVNLREALAARFSRPVTLCNDANAAAYGERCAGAMRDIDDFFLFTLGTGIGGGIVYHGNLIPVAAEVGHITINPAGPPCGCGNTGCLEAYASATAIIANARAALEKGGESILKTAHQGNIYKLTAEEIYKAALDGDALARLVLREAGKALGIGIGTVINLFSPDAVILTGGLTGAWNIYGEAAIAEAAKRTIPELLLRTKIMTSALGDDAGIIGAAALAFQAAGLSLLSSDLQ
jgi:glucokinase